MAIFPSDPFVSIIIPSFNESKHISSCLSSVLGQDWPKDRLEVIVVDNGSTDRTVEIASSLLDNVDCGTVLRKIGGTIASVRNYGWRHAKGDILAFLDGDSVVPPSWISAGVDLLNSINDSVCIGFKMAIPDEDSHWVQKAWFDFGNSSRHIGTNSVEWLCSFNLIVRRDLFEEVKGFDETLETGEDYDFGKRISSLGRLIFSDNITVKHLGNVNSLKEFILKEFWRGRGDFYDFVESENMAKQLIVKLLPVLFTVSVVYLMFFIPFLSEQSELTFIPLFIIIFLPIAMVFRARVFSLVKLCRGWGFFALYYLSRGFSTLLPRCK